MGLAASPTAFMKQGKKPRKTIVFSEYVWFLRQGVSVAGHLTLLRKSFSIIMINLDLFFEERMSNDGKNPNPCGDCPCPRFIG